MIADRVVNLREDFGRLVQANQERLGLSDRGLCSKLGGNYVSVSNWKKGAAFPRDPGMLAALCETLGIAMDTIDVLALVHPRFRENFADYFSRNGSLHIHRNSYPLHVDKLNGVHKSVVSGDSEGSESPKGVMAGYSIGKNGEYGRIIGESLAMHKVFQTLERITKNPDQDTVILIEGGSGTGKELFARGIHYNGARGSHPFVPVNITNVQEELVESQLFGHRRGSFTGAVEERDGFFGITGGGTLFLDEIGAMGKNVQAKLLRVLQERTYYRVGDTVQKKFNGRVVVATKEDLGLLVQQDVFREDLFYRLNIVPVQLPLLHARSGDHRFLFSYFVWQYNAQYKTAFDVNPTREGEKFMEQYAFPGNVRELENLVRRAIFHAEDSYVRIEEVYGQVQQAESATQKDAFLAKVRTGESYENLSLLERSKFDLITSAYFDTGGNLRKIGERIGMSYSGLLNTMKRWGTKGGVWKSLF